MIFGITKVYKIIKCAENNFLEEIENGVADIIDNVQRGLGMLPWLIERVTVHDDRIEVEFKSSIAIDIEN